MFFLYSWSEKYFSRYDTKSKNPKEKTDMKLCDNTIFKIFIEKSQNTKTTQKKFISMYIRKSVRKSQQLNRKIV